MAAKGCNLAGLLVLTASMVDGHDEVGVKGTGVSLSSCSISVFSF